MRTPWFVQRAIAICILITAIVLPIAFASFLGAAYQDGTLAILERREVLGRLHALVSSGRPANNTGSAEDGLRTLVPDAAGAAHLAAYLQTHVKALAASAGVEVLQVSDRKPDPVDGLNYAGISVNLTGSIEAVHELLVNIETQKPLLFVDAARFANHQVHQAHLSQPVLLTLEIDLSTAVRPDPPSAKSDTK